jgi:hypothetical protein
MSKKWLLLGVFGVALVSQAEQARQKASDWAARCAAAGG